MTERDITPSDLQFLYNLLLDKCSMTMREGLTADDIMRRLEAKLFPREGDTPKE